MNMNNVPVIKVGIVAVSRDCFPESLAVNRRKETATVEAKMVRHKNNQRNGGLLPSFLYINKKSTNKNPFLIRLCFGSS